MARTTTQTVATHLGEQILEQGYLDAIRDRPESFNPHVYSLTGQEATYCDDHSVDASRVEELVRDILIGACKEAGLLCPTCGMHAQRVSGEKYWSCTNCRDEFNTPMVRPRRFEGRSNAALLDEWAMLPKGPLVDRMTSTESTTVEVREELTRRGLL